MALAEQWHSAPRRWGSQLHNICSYMAMFPPALPHVLIDWLSAPEDLVYDPFCGRGTVPLEACLMGRRGYGSDLNPLALILTGAKVDPPSWDETEARLDDLAADVQSLPTADEADCIRTIFSEMTLGQLLWIRATLDPSDRTDRFLLAVLAGILHLNADSSGHPRGLTVSMPNTFSMAPRYIMGYVDRHGLVPPEVDVVSALRRRLDRLHPHMQPHPRGRCWSEDAASSTLTGPEFSADLIVTSPPYLHVVKYGKFNWLRLWLLGIEPKAVDSSLFSTSSLSRYVTFMTAVIKSMAGRISPKGHVCLVIGDVADEEKTTCLADLIAGECLAGTGLTNMATIADVLPGNRKVSRIWGEKRGRATRTDRILVLGGSEAGDLPSVPACSWA